MADTRESPTSVALEPSKREVIMRRIGALLVATVIAVAVGVGFAAPAQAKHVNAMCGYLDAMGTAYVDMGMQYDGFRRILLFQVAEQYYTAYLNAGC